MDARRRKALLLLILAGLAGFVAHDQFAQRTASDLTVKATSGATAERLTRGNGAVTRPSPSLPSSTERAPLAAPRAELFAPHTWQPPAPQVAATAPTPIPPAIPYRFAGTLSEGGVQQILLSKGDAVFPIKVGETLEGTYQVESIGETEIVFQYLPLRYRQSIPISSAIAVAAGATAPRSDQPRDALPQSLQVQAREAQTARLEWNGPQRVRLGEAFDVSLKVNSSQPVQSAPMQLRFDPAILESIAVKPGRFFGAGERNFTHRVNSDGTIFVGGSAIAPAAAADSELLVLTFKAVSPTPETLLAVTTLGLLGPHGKSIAFEQLTTYRTTIFR